ncbi:hypothetical protein XENTR_v10006502 [Xenopus tropicalis]|nr:hypothetical protein XENTR_v10006502 [Xenopus tropicalis]
MIITVSSSLLESDTRDWWEDSISMQSTLRSPLCVLTSRSRCTRVSPLKPARVLILSGSRTRKTRLFTKKSSKDN